MPDVFTQAKRSEVMSRIRSRGNRATELVLVKLFRAHGITGWRRHRSIRFNVQLSTSNVERSKLSVGRWKFSVRPDFVFPRFRLAIFVDGCFWHGCPQHATQPKGNAAFWRKKIAGNRRRDALVNRELKRAGWRVLRIWEHALGPKGEQRLLGRIRKALS